MISKARTEVLAQHLRRLRVPVFTALFVIVIGCDLLHIAHPWMNAAGAVFAVLFWYLPGIETVVRNFRAGYHESH